MAIHTLVVIAMKYARAIAQLKNKIVAIATQPQANSAKGYKKDIGCLHALQRPLAKKYPAIGMRYTGRILSLQKGQ